MTTTHAISLDALAASLSGRLIRHADADYDAARQVFIGGYDLRPAAIARVASADDVARVIDFARDSGIELAVRSGGHSAAAHGSTEGGLVLDLRDLRGLDIDVDRRTVWAQTGLTALDVTTATAQHGLAVGFGDTGSVGISGITLGGGIGYVARRHGLTINSLLAAELVTADGRLRVVDADHEPDLFWAIRGGGGNFGVATRVQFRLSDVSSVTGGMLVLPATAATIEGFIAAAEAAPDELCTIANIMPAPPMPFLPPDQHGKLIILAFILHLGDRDVCDAAIAPFRALAKPIADMVKPIAYPEIYPPEDPSYRPTPVQHTMFLERIDGNAAKTIVEHLEASDAPLRAAQLRVLGGAVARVPHDATAYAHRQRRILAVLVNFHTDAPGDIAKRQRWALDFAAAMDQGAPGAYVNFLGEDGPERIHEAYPGGTFDRLAELKRRYDPTNLFHLNQNIPPASA